MTLRRVVLPLMLTSSLAAGVLSQARLANACSPALPPELFGALPHDGQTDIAIDVSPVIVGQASSLSVVGPGGDEPSFEVDEHEGYIEVWFDEPLAPNATYTLMVGFEYSDEEITFTTGRHSTSAYSLPTNLMASAIVGNTAWEWQYACYSSTSWLCVGAEMPTETVLEVTVTRDGVEQTLLVPSEQERVQIFDWAFSNVSDTQLRASHFDVGTCVETAVRYIDGHREHLGRLCEEDIDVMRVEHLSMPGCEGGLISHDSSVLVDVAPTTPVVEEEDIPDRYADAGSDSPPLDAGRGAPISASSDGAVTTRSEEQRGSADAGARSTERADDERESRGSGVTRGDDIVGGGNVVDGGDPAGDSRRERADSVVDAVDDESASTTEPSAHRGVDDSSDAGGCTVTPGAARGGASLWAMIALAAGALGRRRRS